MANWGIFMSGGSFPGLDGGGRVRLAMSFDQLDQLIGA